MRPAFPSNRVPSRKILFLLAVLFPLALSVRAQEDPLLGRIKVIQCVGCTPGSVDLVIHDPIDVRDFQVRINESDYQKIITPLPGKTVYDKNGCFYWFDAPKAEKASGKADAGKDKDKGAGKAAPRKAPKPDTAAAAPDSANPAVPPPVAEVHGTPSRCIPYTRVEAKPAESGKKKD
jgi:hypothetical protein